MLNGLLIGNILGALMLPVWVFCLVSWIRRGIKIPQYIHVLALSMTCLSVGCLVGMMVGNVLTLNMIFPFLLVPSVGTYFGWLWLFGPELSDAKGTAT